jgi:protoheme IX farnesyltransferase
VNALTALLAGFTSFAYLFIYTPLKKRTPLSTIVGAVPGALPPMIGWAAAANRLDVGAWILFGVVFLWQIPHFLAIAWMYREDYERGGFPVLPVLDHTGRRTALWMVVFTVLLVALTLVAPRAGLGGTVHLVGAVLAGGAFLASCVAFARVPGRLAARRVLLGSVLYLPIVLGATLLDYLPAL